MNRQQLLQQLTEVRECLREDYGVKDLMVFGFVARGDVTQDSDLDVIVEFDRAATFDRYMDLKFYLEDLVGCDVDLVTRQALKPSMRQQIEREAIRVP